MRKAIAAIALIWMVTAAPRAVGDPSFTRIANTEAGRLVMESGDPTVVALDPTDAWQYQAQDILPFDYEQGVAFTGDGLVFSSRGALVRTTLGCPAPEDDSVPCYDEEVERPFGIAADEFQMGFDHIGDIDVGLAGDAEGFVFAPLETQTRGGTCPRTNRGYKTYRVSDLSTAGRFIETEVCHRNHSWVTVDGLGHWLLAADPGEQTNGSFAQTVRVLEIARSGPVGSAEEISITPNPALNITVTSAEPLPNYAGCAFRSALVLYCSDWLDEGDIDIATRIYRIDLSGPVGTSGVTGQGKQILFLELEPKYTGVDIDLDGDTEPVVPFGNETEGITFSPRSPGGPVEMNVLVRGETLGWFYYVHLAPGPDPLA